jgi:hypothetical protein
MAPKKCYTSFGIYQKENKSTYKRNTFTLMFIAALCTIAKLRNQLMCPTTNEGIKKMWYIYTVEYYLSTKRNEIMLFAEKWMELMIIILRKISQAQKAK